MGGRELDGESREAQGAAEWRWSAAACGWGELDGKALRRGTFRCVVGQCVVD